MSVALMLHVLAAVVWVGGMFFAWVVLRPACTSLSTDSRLSLWREVLRRFFGWVWAAVILLPVTGYWMIGLMGGMRAAGVHVHVMQALGIVMILLFLHVWFAPYRRLAAAVTRGEPESAGAQLAMIRRLVGVNLVLGIVTVAVATALKYWG